MRPSRSRNTSGRGDTSRRAAAPGIHGPRKGAGGGDLLRTGGRYLTPDAILMHPNTWGTIRRLKATTGEYLIGAPTEAINMQMWGVPVAVSTQVPANKVVVANFQEPATAVIRASLSVRTNPNGTGFRNNVVEIVAEERIALAAKAPTAICIATMS